MTKTREDEKKSATTASSRQEKRQESMAQKKKNMSKKNIATRGTGWSNSASDRPSFGQRCTPTCRGGRSNTCSGAGEQKSGRASESWLPQLGAEAPAAPRPPGVNATATRHPPVPDRRMKRSVEVDQVGLRAGWSLVLFSNAPPISTFAALVPPAGMMIPPVPTPRRRLRLQKESRRDHPRLLPFPRLEPCW